MTKSLTLVNDAFYTSSVFWAAGMRSPFGDIRSEMTNKFTSGRAKECLHTAIHASIADVDSQAAAVEGDEDAESTEKSDTDGKRSYSRRPMRKTLTFAADSSTSEVETDDTTDREQAYNIESAQVRASS